ncbi:uncharacterized protein Z519_06982 [Cladophialophora bantiana CBS 173.52]|uniref:Uncharacterized protein n=1 Tax=Cladophialophora bantiana (strain ATCC 10958 / CBS 173.52 / CDC B-1940 / NIH 8579) TaxID=1442370 RepID=A0A0D2HMM4_CLAB1|nr:uncharacterized protein Z519_06982 [Cladophialophora bantiana CBS 173.52]KIW92000.1 hypothetical protein Z519_06982 [Cladophialophora bantiana CBS 173.52]
MPTYIAWLQSSNRHPLQRLRTPDYAGTGLDQLQRLVLDRGWKRHVDNLILKHRHDNGRDQCHRQHDQHDEHCNRFVGNKHYDCKQYDFQVGSPSNTSLLKTFKDTEFYLAISSATLSRTTSTSLAPAVTQHMTSSSSSSSSPSSGGSQPSSNSAAPTAAATTSVPDAGAAGQLGSSAALVLGVFAAVIFLS